MKQARSSRQTASSKPSINGFTIIELMIATLVFSIVLVTVMASFIQISRVFYKGVNMTNTQDDTRNAMSDITTDIQYYSGGNFQNVPIPGQNYFCIGDHRYSYFLDQQVGATPNAGIYRDNVSNGTCPSISSGPFQLNTATANQLLGSGMQLNNFTIDCSNGITCNLDARVISYGSSPAGLFASTINPTSPWLAPDATCTGSLTSSQFCAVVDFSRTVLQSPY